MDEARRFAVYKAEYERRIAERREKLMRDTRAVFRAMDGWARVETADAWQEMVAKAAEDLETGEFLIDRLGAERYLDPELMAALLVLRRRLIDEYGAESAADLMLIDVAVLSLLPHAPDQRLDRQPRGRRSSPSSSAPRA